MMDYYFGPLEKATFVKRDNRFRAQIQLDTQIFKAHVPNSGRMAELLVPGVPVWVRKTENPLRKTAYDLLLVEKEGTLVCLNAHLANDLFAVWLKKGKLLPFNNYRAFYREKAIGQSRIDFFLEFPQYESLVEIKSVNLVDQGLALFPDAPTARGSKHLEELISFKDNGHQAAVVFIIMRDDAQKLSPHYKMDPLFGSTIRKAVETGVQVIAYKCKVTEQGMKFNGEVPIIL
jgi:sugar fermentation stimulation protein A